MAGVDCRLNTYVQGKKSPLLLRLQVGIANSSLPGWIKHGEEAKLVAGFLWQSLFHEKRITP